MSTELDTNTQPEQTTQPHTWRRPRYDVLESDDAFDVRVCLPGVKREGLDISVDGDNLSVTGTLAHAAMEGWRPLRRELPDGDYRLNLRLNVDVKESKIRAHVEDGILDLTLPKADAISAVRFTGILPLFACYGLGGSFSSPLLQSSGLEGAVAFRHGC